MKKLDFAIIGAGKSGTTSLFKYLSLHPQIFMPGVKEVSFFAVPSLYAKGVAWYYREFFDNADPGLKWGEASPAYMTYSATPSRMREHTPDIKLVAILRNPIDRAFSHHQHLVRSGREARNFNACIQRLMERGSVPDEQVETSEGWHSEYVMDGEYGRLLENFLQCFPKEQLKVYFFEELQSDPAALVKDLYQWLGLESENLPRQVGRVYNPGGTIRFPLITNALRRSVRAGTEVIWLNKLLRRVGVRTALAEYWFKFNTEYAVRHQEGRGPSLSDRRLLLDFYRDDVRKLEGILCAKTPWNEFYAQLEQPSHGTANNDSAMKAA